MPIQEPERSVRITDAHGAPAYRIEFDGNPNGPSGGVRVFHERLSWTPPTVTAQDLAVAAMKAAGLDKDVEYPDSAYVTGLKELLGLILDDMSTATNADLACDGDVGDDETKVWELIERKARELRNTLYGTGCQCPEGMDFHALNCPVSPGQRRMREGAS